MFNYGRRPRGEAGHPVPRGNCFRRPWRKLFLWAVVGSMIVLINIFLLRGALTKLNQIHHPEQPVSLSPPTELPTELPSSPPSEPIVTFGTMGTVHDVRKYGAGESGFSETTGDERSARLLGPGELVTPPSWDSTLCMEHWGRPELLTEADPNGYVVFVNGAEQLGGNKYLLADGMFIAKMLDRTLVEFPAKDARISVANSTMGLGAYWDLLAMCMTHRILDIRAFRRLVETGSLAADDFVTIETHQQPITTHHFRHRDNVLKYFEDKLHYKVIVMEGTWKSTIHRRNLMYLSPNPFFLGVSRMLSIGKEDFRNGEFIAVQWRTETATGDISACYDEVRAVIEENRIALGYTRNQVLFSTDMYGSTSGTYNSSKKKKVGEEAIRRIREDYPKALDNRLHDFFEEIKDSGVKAIVSGLVVAQARILLASSLNKPKLKATPEASDFTILSLPPPLLSDHYQ
ncbi:unnamed protein product [Ascophyllum nodosum]